MNENTTTFQRAYSSSIPKRAALKISVLLLSAASAMMSYPGMAADADADNTKRNQQDDSKLTPIDQSNDQNDINIVAAIRSAITDDSALSTNAKNSKVIVRQGVVTLRGPVENAKEKTHIEHLAKNTHGVVRVDNQLTVKN